MRKHPSLKQLVLFALKATFVFILVMVTVGFGLWYADRTEGADPRDTFAVEGKASRKVTPDTVNLTIGSYLEGNDVLQLQEDANSAVNDATQRILDLGIEEENIRTSNYNLSSDYYWQDDKDDYSIDVTISITITNIESRDKNIVGDILAAAADANLNQVRSLSYDISNREDILDELELEAIEDAKSKKGTYEDTSGLKLGKVVDIVRGGGSYPPYPLYESKLGDIAATDEASRLGAPIEVQVGQDELQVTVTVYYEVK